MLPRLNSEPTKRSDLGIHNPEEVTNDNLKVYILTISSKNILNSKYILTFKDEDFRKQEFRNKYSDVSDMIPRKLSYFFGLCLNIKKDMTNILAPP